MNKTEDRAALLAELARLLKRLDMIGDRRGTTAYDRALTLLEELDTRLQNDRVFLGQVQGTYHNVPFSAELMDAAQRLEARIIIHRGLLWQGLGELALSRPSKLTEEDT